MSTGQTFGDSPSPANFEPMARGRQQYAQHLWHQVDTLLLAAPCVPRLRFQAPPTDPSIFFQPTADSFHTGVFDCHGARRSPTYDHHVDDNICGDVEEIVPLGVAASILALCLILGYPGPRTEIRSPGTSLMAFPLTSEK